ncbi:subtilisin-like serine protease [Coccidioides posadasii str. Silveira]|uniref:Subtilisin-like protease CPC735_050320 n=3 Tax=Coccidioides posadasii TaxID=199306 RepID=SUB7A_COCP7|nr:subtilisin-like protease, putative [Coccidioides posadasii C735 delta SOWgp]C5PGK9.1 RecName: Full=Subtilisin-like protease CPC735_050320; Flags: Precursor [Coccidioides posadasii C735 delta SOWgp]EFW21628.1 alkaline proteinase [Coccidioides posadasii str. Silveira]KMM65102.1 alkaline proteinase [Coccidioides posadasii RMSCC 3488]EER23662.1 subtilisin-like protease, putative [Coccidioides posadasii C735 delta SOWgp]QVM07088.1 subtilisin-like serine protease [Coccidioides posadasii str. Silv|eukprot:XP_003065807.1 subtilisin-like protease, putative [Coccidioides posadasii C735 delta SOWgp]
MVFLGKILPLALAALSVNGAEILSAPGAENIPNGYIVVMKEGTSTQDFDAHREWVASVHHERLARRGSTNVGGMRHTYNFNQGFMGYAGTFDEETIQEIANRDDVAYIERDQIMKASAIQTQRNVPSWGLARVSSRQPGGRDYSYDSTAGQGVTAYIIDTGIDIRHTDFGGRAVWGTNTVDRRNEDCNGHGTHVAGTTGGTSFGVAKRARLVAVKVLDCNGSGSNSAVIAGMQWAMQHASQNDPRRAVANMSLGGGYSQASNQAAAAIVRAGIFLAVAAGNDNRDARSFSPASEPTVCTAAASHVRDGKASFSNWGQLVDVYAPGQDIISARPGGGSRSLSGTSMASPHVCGLGAYLIGLGRGSGGGLCDTIKRMALPVISNPGSGTTNRLINNGVSQ